jgi:hypothetical protein
MIRHQMPGVYLGLFPDESCIHAGNCKDGYDLRKLQRHLNATEMWCKLWNIMNKDETEIIYVSQTCFPWASSYIEWTDTFLRSCKISRFSLQ